MATGVEWLDADFISKQAVWLIFDKEQYEEGDHAKALLPWTAEPLIGTFQPVCLNRPVAEALIAERKLNGLAAVEVRELKELHAILSWLVLIKMRNIAVYLGKNDVRFFQTIHLLEALDGPAGFRVPGS